MKFLVSLSGYFNLVVLQWFGYRIAVVVSNPEKMMEGDFSALGWSLLRAYPLSGYGDRPFRFWGESSVYYMGKHRKHL